MPDLLLAPYLPLANSVVIGSWQVLPFKRLRESDVVPEDIRRPVERLIEAYSRDDGMGAVVFPDGAEVGAGFEMPAFTRLGLALLAGLVGANPPMAVEDEGPNAGWSVATSENVRLYGHPLGDGNSYALQVGMLARVLSGHGALEDEPLPKVDPPVELPTPRLGSFDVELADATYAVLGTEDVAARQLHRSLDWYRIVLSNAEAVSVDVRVGSARSALEVLTGAGDKTKRLVRAYGRLVREEDAVETTYAEADVFWASGPVQLTADEWWITRLCELRNAIMHGDDVAEELWHHDGHHQLSHIHDSLLKALRAQVAAAVNDPLLRLPKRDRIFPRASQEALEMMKEEGKLPEGDPSRDQGEKDAP